MKTIIFSTKYKKSMKDVRKYPEYNSKELEDILVQLAEGKKIDARYRDHAMASNSALKGIRGFHLRGNLVILYRITDDSIELIDIGRHNKVRLTSSL